MKKRERSDTRPPEQEKDERPDTRPPEQEKDERPDTRPAEDRSEHRAESAPDGGVGLGEAGARVAELEAQLEEARDKYLRALADLDNYRKRAERERSDLLKSAGERVVAGILDVLDGFDQALAVDPEAASPESFLEGLDLLRRRLLQILEKEGLSEIVAADQPFDPNLHEAVIQIESDEIPSGTVVEELRKGYLLNERLLRPARVSVAK